MLANRIRIAASMRKDGPAIGQLYGVIPSGGCNISFSTAGVDDPAVPSPGSVTVASFAAFLPVKPNWTRQRNTMLVTMRWRRQTSATHAGLLRFQHDGELLFIREASLVRASVPHRAPLSSRFLASNP